MNIQYDISPREATPDRQPDKQTGRSDKEKKTAGDARDILKGNFWDDLP